jgi:hypothetical protein
MLATSRCWRAGSANAGSIHMIWSCSRSRRKTASRTFCQTPAHGNFTVRHITHLSCLLFRYILSHCRLEKHDYPYRIDNKSM